MMRNSGILRWTNNKNNTNNKHNAKNGNKNWLHPPEALQKGHIAYLVKFLGSTEVEQPKGIEVVKEGIRKLKFSQQLKKAEGSKTPKVELTVSIDGVAIQEPKSKKNLHQYPLHRISYCADDKAEKRFFSFIARESDTEKHTCFVFVSDKLAEEITLTIGQAFDLAYRRFVETSGREMELRRQVLVLQKKMQGVEEENSLLKTRLTQMAQLKDREDVDTYMREHNISDILTLNGESSSDPVTAPSNNGAPPPPVPPRNANNGDLIEDLLSSTTLTNGDSNDDDFNPRAANVDNNGLDDDFNPRAEEFENGGGGGDDDFDPRAEESKPPNFAAPTAPIINGGGKAPPALIPPPRPSRPHEVQQQNGGMPADIFGSSPAPPVAVPPPAHDPFANNSFSPSANSDILAHFHEMKAGFSRGIAFESAEDDFTLESLDPLKN